MLASPADLLLLFCCALLALAESAGRTCPRVLYRRPCCDHTAGEHMTPPPRPSQFSAPAAPTEALIKWAEQGLIKQALITEG